MIIRSHRKTGAAALPSSASKSPQLEKVFDEEAFRFEICKEISRSNRRATGREFAIVRFPVLDQPTFAAANHDLLVACRNRLRLSDLIGWLDGLLTVLLPETDREGARVVANDLSQRLAAVLPNQAPLDSEISVFPWDDDLTALSEELPAHETDTPLYSQDIRESGFQRFDRPHDNGEKGLETQDRSNNGAGPSAMKSARRKSRRATDRMPFVQTQRTPWWKRAVDIVGAGSGLIMLSPVFLGAAIAIKCSSRGPVFFGQRREGKDGVIFGILKFRTMGTDAEAQQNNLREISEQDGPAFKLANDPRVTKVGKYLRRSCVDELPQLVNVLIGQMSLVGPRPLPVGESYGCKAWQRARLTVLPGLTCTWQAHGGRDTKFDDWMRMDLDYIEKQSFLFDLKLIFQTAVIALLHRGSV